jgi:hypothetical protein
MTLACIMLAWLWLAFEFWVRAATAARIGDED